MHAHQMKASLLQVGDAKLQKFSWITSNKMDADPEQRHY